MPDAERCVSCGEIIPEGKQVCSKCELSSSGSPTIEDVRAAAKIIVYFCVSRKGDPRTNCIKCPIRDICLYEPYLWEV